MAARKRWRRYIPDDEISVRAFLHLIGRLFYYVGLHSEYFLLNFGRGARAAVLALWHGVCWMLALGANILRPFFAAVWEDLRAPWRQMRSGLRNIRQVVREEREAGGSPAGKGLAYFFRGVLAYKHLLLRGLAYLLPAAALGVLLVTVDGVLSSTFALRVEFRGEFVGFIANESVYDAAHADILDRIQNVDTGEDWKARPEYTLTIVDQAALYSQGELTDRIIETSSAEFREATGVYVNTEFIGVTADSAALTQALEALKEPLYEGHENDDSWRVEFQQNVELKPGLYFTSTIITLDDLLARLHGTAPVELSDGNILVGWDMLGVQAVQNVTRTVETAAEPQVINDPELEWGREVVEQEASPGLEEVNEDVVYIDGQEVQRIQTREPTVLVEAVPQITRYGTYNPYGGTAGDPATGEFTWPVPDYKGISRWASRYHRGADITARYGTTIVAADNGVVEVATDARGTAWWTYGKFVKVDHGNGFATVYAHCSELLVQQGEYVVKGQPIARVGSTGYSTGNHCHFEIQVNGQWTDTRRYVMPSGYTTQFTGVLPRLGGVGARRIDRVPFVNTQGRAYSARPLHW